MSDLEKRHPANAALRARVDEILQKHQTIRDELANAEKETLALVRGSKPTTAAAPGRVNPHQSLLQPDELQALRQVSDPSDQP
jgi:hypothetical protein